MGRNEGEMLKKNIVLIVIVFVAFSVWSRITIFATELPPIDLGVIVVTPTRSERTIKDLSASVSVITREEIESSNANTCTDILNTLPGLFVNKTGAFGRADVDIRGIGDKGRSIMVLIDGRPVKMGLYGCTVTHTLPLDNVERIEVVRGPASVLYGSDALGGVINIITRKAKKGVETDVSSSYGTYNTQVYKILHGANFSKYDYYITGDLRMSDGHVENSAYDARNFTGRFGYEITDNSTLSLTAKYFDGLREEPSPSPAGTWNDYKRGAVDITFDKKLDKWKYTIKGYRNLACIIHTPWKK